MVEALQDAAPLLKSSDSGAYERFLRFLFRFVCPKWLSSLTVARRREYVDPLIKGYSPVMVVIALSEVLVGDEEAPGEGIGLLFLLKICTRFPLFFSFLFLGGLIFGLLSQGTIYLYSSWSYWFGG